MSNTVRVYELARETGLDNKEVVRRLNQLDIDATSHSSSVTLGDAQRFRESLGRSDAERKAAEEDARRKQEEEEARFRALAEKAKAANTSKAKKVLPPHLREQGNGDAADRAPAKARKVMPPGMRDEAEAGSAEPAPASADAAEPTEATPEPAAGDSATSAPADATTDQAEAPAATADDDAGDDSGDTTSTSGRRMPGMPPPRLVKGEVPLRPSRPKPEAPKTVTGEATEARRKVETTMPKKGSGKRHIPAPIKKASERPKQPSRPSGGRPGGGGRSKKSSSPYRQPTDTNKDKGDDRGGGKPGGKRPGGGRHRREKTSPREQELQRRPMRHELPLTEQIEVDRVELLPGVTVGELADKLDVQGGALVKKLFDMGEMVTVQQSLPDDTLEILAAELGFEVYFMSQEEAEFGIEEPEATADLQPRPPVITVMGHVDHGKTLLLDALRSTDVVSGEAGGITQHIGAYQIHHDDKPVTFIDTPGHAAFTAMRQRGADVTDIVILVVAANDGVMPQTVEAIQHARAAEVPIVVAVNKVDLPEADPSKAKGQLAEHEVIVEEYGGEVPVVEVSALEKTGLDELLEVVQLQAELLELQANPNKDARGRVVEAHLDKGRGAVATLLVQAGTLRRGDILVAGTADGKVRAMFDEHGEQVDEAEPARPVQVLGLNEVPEAGDEFRVVDEERFARDVAERRTTRERRVELAAQSRPKTLEDLTAEVKEGSKEVLNVLIKADVSGSAEALEDALSKMDLEEVRIEVVGKGVGAITESDVQLADVSDGIVVGFNVRPGAKAREAIERSGVDVRLYNIIYEALEDIERAVKGLLGPDVVEEVIGEAEVREIFKVPKVGFVFGCYVTDGVVRRDAGVRVVRDGVVVAEDELSSLRRFTDDVNEVREGFECGIGLDKFQDVKEGDVLEAYETVEVERT